MNTIDSTKGGLGVALAILGCILGLAGSWAGLTAKNSQADTRAKLEGLENLVGSLSTENQNLSMKVQGLSDQVQQTQQVLITQFGQPIRVINEPGLHYKVPFIQSVITLRMYSP
jgi:hypothetical protein